MAATKSLVSLCSQAVLLFAVAALVVQTQVAQPQAQTCTDQLGKVNVCAPYVLPGAANTNPSAECCAALQATQHDCLCNTLSIAGRLPSLCNLPPLSCGS
ncbi:Protein MEN-8 [Sarracenia purpurea var. burkii]